MSIEKTEQDGLMQRLKEYFEDTLNCSLDVTPWATAKKLQYYLQNTYLFMEAKIFGIAFIAMIEREDGSVSVPEIRKHMDNLAAKFPDRFVFVTSAVTANERRRMIEKGVQFIVPGAQMFIPAIGMDLREHFPRRSVKVDAMGPATQAMLIRQLSTPWLESLQLSEVSMGRGYSFLGKAFDYTRMTISRSVKELESFGLLELIREARNGFVHGNDIAFKMSSAQIWQKARPHMKTPVKKTMWVEKPPTDPSKLLIAGESALAILARETMLADPRLPVYAIGVEQYNDYVSNGVIHEAPEDEATCQLEIWSYEPISIFRWSPCVDVFSLILSFQGHDDPRIQQCVEELEGMVKW